MTTNRRFRQHYGAFRSDHFVNNLGENSPKSPLLPIRRFRQIRQHFGALIAGLIYSLLSFRQQLWRLAKFRQNRHFRLSLHFWTYII